MKKTNVTDDSKIPDPGAAPQRGPSRKKRRERSFAPSMGASASNAPNIPPRLTLFVIVLGFLLVAAWVSKPELFKSTTRTASDRVFDTDAAPKTGTTPAEAAAMDAKTAQMRKVAEGLFGPELFTVKDGEDFAEEPQWRRLVAEIGKMDPRSVSERLEFSLNNHYGEALKDPERFRGRFVRMRGIVLSNFGAKRLKSPIDGRVDVYRGWIKDPDEDAAPVVFDVPEHPPFFRTMYDAVDVDGVFYRTVRYETVDERDTATGAVIRKGKWVEVPWIVARTVTPCQPADDGATTTFWVGGMAAFLALAGSIVYLVRRGRRPGPAAGAAPAGFRSMFAQRLREERPKEPPSTGQRS